MRETVYNESPETNDLMNSIIGSMICILGSSPIHLFICFHSYIIYLQLRIHVMCVSADKVFL